MNLLNLLLASTLTSLVLIAILEIKIVTQQIMLFLGLLILGLVVSLLIPNNSNNDNIIDNKAMVQIDNQLKSLNSKVYDNQNNILADNVPITNTAVNYANNNSNNYVNNIPFTNRAVNYANNNSNNNANNYANNNSNNYANNNSVNYSNNVELNNLKKMLEADKKIYKRVTYHNNNKINNFKELHNPPIPNNKSEDCVADLSCVVQDCKCK